MDVASWLRSLGLEKYEQAFREGEIDADILPELTDQDLEKLGIPLGHRKRLLKAIGTLNSKATRLELFLHLPDRVLTLPSAAK